MKKKLLVLLLGLGLASASAAEDSLDRYRPINQENVNTSVLSVVPTAVPVGDGVLQFRVTHRFAQRLNDTTFHDLYSFDSGADIGLGIEYGVTPNLEFGLYRSSFLDDYEAWMKFRWFAQSEGFPLSISTRVGGNYASEPTVDDGGVFGQVIFQRRFGPLDLIVAPTYVQESLFFEDVTNVPVGFVWRMTQSVNLLGEVVAENDDNDAAELAWRVGLEKRVPGHTFALVLGNSRATTVDMEMASDYPGGFDRDDVRIGFNITRRWRW